MKKIMIFLLFLTVILVSGCEGNIQNDSNDPTSTPNLVTGDNLATNPMVSENEEVTIPSVDDISLEDLLVDTIAFAQTATICVKNYQMVEKRVVTGGSWWNPTYETVKEQLLYGTGSGVIYYKALTEDGSYLYKVITNEHVVAVSEQVSVVAGEEEYKIYDENYEEEIVAKLIGSDADNDIAVLEFVSSREYNAVKFAKIENVKAGKFVVTMGTPIDLKYYNTATYGIISRVKAGYIQHDAAINSGNSGGPLYDLNGYLVGINNAKLSGSTSSGVSIEGIYFAIPINIVAECVNTITGLDEIIYA